jgi:hypothetical protein
LCDGRKSQHKEGRRWRQQSSLLPNEKQQLEVCIAVFERQKKELKAKLAELETSQNMKTKATIAASETKNNNVKGVTCKPLSWFCYMDDTFAIYLHDPGKLSGLLNYLNSVHQ